MLLEVNQAETVFQKMLVEANIKFIGQNQWGFSIVNNPNPQIVWRIFKEFAKLKINVDDSEDDALLFQWGISQELETQIQYFYLDFTRQFVIYNQDGTYNNMEQLNCTVMYNLAKGIDISDGNFWSYKFNNCFESFFNAVEKTEQFYLGINKYKPFRLEMIQGKV